MKTLIAIAVIAAGFAIIGAAKAQAMGYKSYAYQYCYYYKARALGARSHARSRIMWARYYACLREYGH